MVKIKTLRNLSRSDAKACRRAVKLQGGTTVQTDKGLVVYFRDDKNPYSRPFCKWENALLDLGWV